MGTITRSQQSSSSSKPVRNRGRVASATAMQTSLLGLVARLQLLDDLINGEAGWALARREFLVSGEVGADLLRGGQNHKGVLREPVVPIGRGVPRVFVRVGF